MQTSRRGQTVGAVHIEEDRIGEVQAALTRLSKIAVMVGIPSDQEQPHYGASPGATVGTEARPGDPIGNAALGYIHEFGSPINNIPGRHWLVPGLDQSKGLWTPYLEQAARAGMEGKADLLDKALHKAGMSAVSEVQLRIRRGLSPPLEPATVAARRRRSAGSTYRRKATSIGDVTPLYDTGSLLNSISYVVRYR
jgi:hypothetical protein